MPKESEPFVLSSEQASQMAPPHRGACAWEQGPQQERAGVSPAAQPCLPGPKVQLSPRGCPKTMFKHDTSNHTG